MSEATTTTDTVIQVIKWICNTLFHQFVAVVAVYSIWVPIINYSNPFSWHVILSTLGIMPLMAEAIILFSNDNTWTQKIPRKIKYWIHGILIFIGSFLVITGTALESDRRERARVQYPQVEHFVSAHSVVGLVSVILLFFGLALGLLAFFSARLTKYARPVWFKLVHNIIGQLGYITGVVSLILGYYTSWFEYYTTETSRNAAAVVTVLAAVLSLLCAWKSMYHQIKAIIS